MKLIFGLHAVKALLDYQEASNIQEVIFVSGKLNSRLASLLDLAKAKNISISRLTIKELDKKSSGHRHQGVIALGYQQNLSKNSVSSIDLFSLLEDLTKPALLLILDNIQDPHNLGACLRTANAAGVDAVIAPKDKSVGITPVVSKVASGADQVTPFYQVTNLARTLDQLKDLGIWILGAAGEGEAELYQQDFTGSVAVVMGNEGQGLRRLTKDKCDDIFKIPMLGSVESLNVSVAAAVCLYEVVRQRNI